ncbi:MAG: adenylate/guanylate cyclase domain-containing protein [Anaerolineales bacterium]|nr:adenylate/guanylate cyclase domain-containing protein [Anaerolineales bacterium]
MLSYRPTRNLRLYFESRIKQLAQTPPMTWKPFTYQWQWQLKSSPEELWPYVADTQRVNQAAHLPVMIYTETPLETGGSRRSGHLSKFGLSIEWEEHPFEWVREREYSVLRVFKEGPLARVFIRMVLEPNSAGTLLQYMVEATPANIVGFFGALQQFGWEARRNFERVFQQIDTAIQQHRRQVFPLPVIPLAGPGQARLQELSRQLAGQGHELRWTQRLADLLLTAPDQDLARLRPYVLADTWDAPRRTMLELFLSAAKMGLLNMRWDMLCPLCRGAKIVASSLDEVKKGVHCATCNIDFEADLAQNVELTFTPHPQIRPVYEQTYCVGGPMVTPHILVHQVIEPGETRVLPVEIEAGGYRIRTQQLGVEAWLELNSGQPINALAIRADTDALQVVPLAAPSQAKPSRPDNHALTLTITNGASYAQRIYIERADWYTDAATAAQVTTLQHFRDLFSDQVLRPGEEIGVQSMTVLFSDLVGSTAMYNRWGDATSYAIVREQFAFLQRIIREYEGAIVKTIGDAIMAAFTDPAMGVGAALAIQQEINNFNAVHPNEPLVIKLGLHQGPCLAVNLNNRLDYFGTTVNLAARLEGQSHGGDVVISEKLRRDPAVDKLLQAMDIQVDTFATSIKGFDEHFCLFRLSLPSPAGQEPPGASHIFAVDAAEGS